MAPKTPGIITAFRADRLGARLISLVNAIRLAEKFGVERRMHWMETSGVGNEFNDITLLFDPRFTADLLMERDTWLKFRQSARAITDFKNKDSADVATWLAAGRNIRVETAFGLVCLADEDPAEVARSAREIFLNLPFAAPLVHPIETVRDALQSAVAYHMRRGDLVSNIKAMNKSWPHKFVPEAYYHAHMAQAIDHKQTVIVFSDEPETLASAKAAFPELKTIDDIVPADELTPGARDFFELYAMSACSKIIAPEASAFSSTAATLGGTQCHDVKTDMPDDLRDTCSEELHQILRTTPEALGEVGTVGQTLPHVRSYLIDGGRMDDAIALYEGFVTQRMPISFLYPQYMEMLLETRQFDRLLALAGDMADLPLYDRRSRHRCIAFMLSAQVATSQAGACERTLVSFFAQFPMAAELKKVIPCLLSSETLTADTFLPFSEEIVLGYGRRLGLAGQSKSERDLLELLAPDIANALPKNVCGTPEPFWWDWAPFFPSNVIAVSERKGMLNDVHDSLSQKKFSGLTPDAASTLALLVAHKGRLKPALKMLSQLGADGTENAMVQHRLSVVHRLSRDWKAAIYHAVAAAELSDAPAHQAWAGLITMRDNKDKDRARDYLRAAIMADFPYAIVALNLAEVERRAGRTEAAFAALRIAQELNPADVAPQVAAAELHDSTGAPQAARDIYAQLHAVEKLPMKCYKRLGELHASEGNMHSARDVIDHALRHKPDAPALIKMRATLD